MLRTEDLQWLIFSQSYFRVVLTWLMQNAVEIQSVVLCGAVNRLSPNPGSDEKAPPPSPADRWGRSGSEPLLVSGKEIKTGATTLVEVTTHRGHPFAGVGLSASCA